MTRKKATDFDPELLSLFDRYLHGFLTRRQFFDRAAKFAVGGVTVAALVESLNPKYAEAQQIAGDDPRLQTEHLDYPSPQATGTTKPWRGSPGSARSSFSARRFSRRDDDQEWLSTGYGRRALGNSERLRGEAPCVSLL